MYNHLLYFLYWLAASAILYFAGLVYPANVILGNYRFSQVESAIYAGFWATFFLWTLWDFALVKSLKFDSALVRFGYFFFANAFAFWLVARFSHITGFGIVSYLWALLISLVVTISQRFIWRMVVKR